MAWYPVASVPVALGDGAKFFTEAAAERQRQSQATVTMRVTEEFFGEAPNLAVLDGETFAVTPTSLPAAASVPGIVTCALPPTRLGFASPSLFLLTRTLAKGNGVKVFARTEDVANAQAYMNAATIVAPLIHRWLGTEATRLAEHRRSAGARTTLRLKMATCSLPTCRAPSRLS